MIFDDLLSLLCSLDFVECSVEPELNSDMERYQGTTSSAKRPMALAAWCVSISFSHVAASSTRQPKQLGGNLEADS